MKSLSHYAPLPAAITVSIVLVASCIKLADLPAFAESFSQWVLVPEWLWKPLGILVPNIELAIGLLWWLNVRRRIVTWACMLLLAAFTSVFILHAALALPPDCDCFGKILKHDLMVDSAYSLIPRNLVLMAMLVPYLIFKKTGTPRSVAVSTGHHKPDPTPPPAREPPGFSLPELLVAISVIVLLIAIALPVLGRVRKTAREIASAADLRSHAQIFSVYHNDWDDAFPHFMTPSKEGTVLTAGTFAIQPHYFESYTSWNIALADSYYDGDFAGESFFPASYRDRYPDQDPVFTPIWYSCSLIADPAYWNANTRTGLEQWRATRIAEVRFPAAKATLVFSVDKRDRTIPNQSLRYELAAADGSVTVLESREIAPGYFRGDGAFNITGAMSGHASKYPPGMHTPDGVKGRDITGHN